jgi:siderophore synthetase component
MNVNCLSDQTALETAEQEAVTRLLNAYIREILQDQLILVSKKNDAVVGTKQSLFRIRLIQSNLILAGSMRYYSLFGHHQYEFPLYLEESQGHHIPLSAQDIIDYMLMDLQLMLGPLERNAFKLEQLKLQIQNSILKTQQYISHHRDQPLRSNTYIQSEQSIISGHPFHPTPKSSEGFSNKDLELYAPELETKFQLVYWAVHKDIIEQADLSTGKDSFKNALPSDVLTHAESYLGNQICFYEILPVHPWQSKYLTKEPRVIGLMEKHSIINFGPLGPEVYPTSSVRTVWSPDLNYFLKLPLNVRITHFIRINGKEHIRRTMDAAKIVSLIKEKVNNRTFKVLEELKYQSVDDADLSDQLAVVYRENPKELIENSHEWAVVAALLEPSVNKMKQHPSYNVFIHLEGFQIAKTDWISHYVQVFLIPVLRTYANWGISLEAHVQNSLVRIHQGLPVQSFIRDLEGVSISRETAQRQGWIGSVLSKDSPVLYSEEETFQRLLYYVFTNHMGHLVSVLAQEGQVNETELWSRIREELIKEMQSTSEASLAGLIDKILNTAHLSAKANLLSWVKGTGEKPLYVKLANPLYEGVEGYHE